MSDDGDRNQGTLEGAHVPVLLRETVEALAPRPGGRYVDGTLGDGGHAGAILAASSPDGELLGVDRDDEALSRARARLARFAARLTIRRSSFADLGELLRELRWDGADGIIVDLGVSSLQLDRPERGFSFSRRGPLDMRMDRGEPRDAARWLREIDEPELAQILRRLGEEPRARRVARAILAAERAGLLTDTLALAAVVRRAAGGSRSHDPATRTFQAIRIAVNAELAELDRFLAEAHRWLRPGGRLVILAYHSLEDRLVKQAFHRWELECLCPRTAAVCRCGWSRKAKVLTRRPLRPQAAEIAANPRSRSARLRAVERLAA